MNSLRCCKLANGESSVKEMHIKLEIMPVKYSAKTNFILCQDFEFVFCVWILKNLSKLQVPTEAEKFLMDRELKNKYETIWRERLSNLMEDLEAAKLTIHNLTQENMNLHVKIQHQTEENQRMLDETSVMFKAQIDRVKVENETLVNNQRPQIKALEDSVASMTRENVKLRHQIQASIELSRKDLK